MSKCCQGCLMAILVKSSKSAGVIVILTHADKLSAVFLITRPSQRQVVRLKPTGASCRCYTPSASTPKVKQESLRASALERKENIYVDSIQTEFLITNQLYCEMFLHCFLLGFTLPRERFKRAQSEKLGCVSNSPTPPLTISV